MVQEMVSSQFALHAQPVSIYNHQCAFLAHQTAIGATPTELVNKEDVPMDMSTIQSHKLAWLAQQDSDAFHANFQMVELEIHSPQLDNSLQINKDNGPDGGLMLTLTQSKLVHMSVLLVLQVSMFHQPMDNVWLAQPIQSLAVLLLESLTMLQHILKVLTIH
jgi:hypothetical protein